MPRPAETDSDSDGETLYTETESEEDSSENDSDVDFIDDSGLLESRSLADGDDLQGEEWRANARRSSRLSARGGCRRVIRGRVPGRDD